LAIPYPTEWWYDVLEMLWALGCGL
jgi:hypothetical protein